MQRGALRLPFHHKQNRLDYAISILEHFIVPEAENAITLSIEPSGSPCIMLLALGMLTTIHLDNQSSL